VFAPVAVVGDVATGNNVPTVAIIGDSVADGYGDTGYDYGYLARTIFALGATTHRLSRVGEQGAQFAAYTGLLRRTRLSACTDAIIEFGLNDIYLGSVNEATLEASILAIVQICLNRGITPYVTTLNPYVSYSGNPYPISQQSIVNLVQNSVRVGYNTRLRNGTTAFSSLIAGVIDAASYIETDANNSTPSGPGAPNNGGLFWCGTGNDTAYTIGEHPNENGHILIAQGIASASPQASTPPIVLSR
jgi:lysophospholipase L1-like esterase